MSADRDCIMANIRHSLRRHAALPDNVAAALRQRLAQSQPNLRPPITGNPITCFIRKMQALGGKVSWVSGIAEVIAVIEAHLDEQQLGDRVVVAPDPELLVILRSNRIQTESRAATNADRISVTNAYAGIAETGEVVLLSGHDNPTTLNFLPSDHIVVLNTERIVTSSEDVWAKMRTEKRPMPRTINYIAGPSRTGDVEMVLQIGAHGPRRLHVVLVGEKPAGY